MQFRLLAWILATCLYQSTSSQDTASDSMTQPSNDTTTSELKLMLQTLQQQVSAIHSTLLTQQTMSANQMCQQLGTTKASPPTDCTEVQERGNTDSGVYMIQPTGEVTGFEVYCDLTTAGGGWTVIQKRVNGSVDFYRSYADYETGFGNLTGEHWLGNKHIHAITNQAKYELRVELEDYKQLEKYAQYASFSVDNATSMYTLHVDGYNGTAGDSLKFDHDNHKFSAPDNDNDNAANANCAEKHHGGYWYSQCFKSNVNGKWGVAGEQGIVWGSFKDWQMYVLKRTEMKIRRVK